MHSHSIVVSARGWLVVNPMGFAKPMVGWKRAPLSAVALTSGVIFDNCFSSGSLKYMYSDNYAHKM
jgi:hypothetical protein